MLSYNETPIEEISDDAVKKAGIRLLIKREDLNHPYVSGNKWWKLKYNLAEARRKNFSTLLTYGGAYSNHIFATAAAAHELGFKSVGIIRGEENLPLNGTLAFARERGMALRYLPRSSYAIKSNATDHLKEFDNFYLIPEGGTNDLAIKGVGEFALKLGNSYEYICCAVGTGGTISGLIEGLPDDKIIIGFAALKGGEFLADEIKTLSVKSKYNTNWQVLHDFHFGGYAKSTPALAQFIERFKMMHNIPLEFVYTGKMMFGIYELLTKGFFKRGSTILAIHSGGLQLENKIF